MKRSHIRTFVFLTLSLLIVCSSLTFAQDSLTVSADSTQLYQTPDTLRIPTIAISLVGSINRTLRQEQIVADSAINLIDYTYFGDLLTMTPGLYMRKLGSAGQWHGMTINGIDGRGIAVMNDGIVLNDPLSGLFNLNLLPTETIDRVEIITGTESFLYGLNSTGGTINVLSKSKKAIRPYSHIRFSESAYGYGFVDGLVSQDIVRGLNFTAGVQHNTLNGRFTNSEYDAWNARFKMRYLLNNKFNFYISENYHQTQLGVNGGVDPATSPASWFDRFLDTLRNTDSYEKLTGHDLQFGIAARPFADSNAVTTLTLYHSTNLREYRDEENRLSPNGWFIQEDHWSQWYGVKLTQHIDVNQFQLDFGAETEARGMIASSGIGQYITTRSALYGKTLFHLNDMLDLSAYSRLDNYQNRTPLSYGGDVRVHLQSWIELFGGYSRSYRFPTIQELFRRDIFYSFSYLATASIPPERHHLLETGFQLSDHQSTSFELTVFHRIIHDAITPSFSLSTFLTPFQRALFIIQPKVTLQGFNARLTTRLGMFYAEGNVQFIEFQHDNEFETTLPKWSGTGGIYFWDKLFNGHLELKTGVLGYFQSPFDGMEFNPQILSFIPNRQNSNDFVGKSDFIIMAHIGSAYLHIVWENIFDQNYYITPVYPMPERTLRFGVSWEFTD